VERSGVLDCGCFGGGGSRTLQNWLHGTEALGEGDLKVGGWGDSNRVGVFGI